MISSFTLPQLIISLKYKALDRDVFNDVNNKFAHSKHVTTYSEVKVIHPANVTNVDMMVLMITNITNDTASDSIMHINETLHALVNKQT